MVIFIGIKKKGDVNMQQCPLCKTKNLRVEKSADGKYMLLWCFFCKYKTKREIEGKVEIIKHAN
jgi:hypothetical protein